MYIYVLTYISCEEAIRFWNWMCMRVWLVRTILRLTSFKPNKSRYVYIVYYICGSCFSVADCWGCKRRVYKEYNERIRVSALKYSVIRQIKRLLSAHTTLCTNNEHIFPLFSPKANDNKLELTSSRSCSASVIWIYNAKLCKYRDLH